MSLFFYCFSVALGVALGYTTGRAWIRDHRNGRWSGRAIAVVAVASVLLGLIVGWGLDTYAAYVRSTMR